ncbi:MAG TPA: beta-galactosidase trimerization domain-containing protein [bacterium]|nr:beta-galactosidase trimerization domain-containing protein [bacterium]HQL63477.1 beta-galactosidase trimerization domain-containing protein [bacterium]
MFARIGRLSRFRILLSVLLLIAGCARNPEQVTWPTFEELSQSAEYLNPPRYEKNAFVAADGHRTFLIGAYGKDDPRFDLYGKRELGELPPSYGLYDPKLHGWIYEQPLNRESATRLGFNFYSMSLNPRPFYETVNYDARVPEDPDYVATFARELRLPFYVDFVAWPWGLGAPGQPDTGKLPDECRNPHSGHWMAYRIIGPGREIWLSIWRLYAQRLREAGVPVLMYELFNEPGYNAWTEDHRAEFIRWLQERYNSLETVNCVWGTSWNSWEEIRDYPAPKTVPSLWLDYDEYLAEKFADLFKAGIDTIREIDPNAVCVIQPRRTAALVPWDAVHYDKILALEEVVVSPTDGGLWTPGTSGNQPDSRWSNAPMAPAPISSDLLPAMAGDRMLFDNELYLTGQTRRDVRNDWWTRVLMGYDGATLFSWSKRGWSWWDGLEKIKEEAEQHPYSALIPIARRTEALRGILDFAREMPRVRLNVLRKPWVENHNIGFVWSWGNARRLMCDGDLPEQAMRYYATLKYTHWPFEMIPSYPASSEHLSQFKVLFLPGTQYLERELQINLENYVRNGGLLVLGEKIPDRTPYGRLNGFDEWLGIRPGPGDFRRSTIRMPEEIKGDGAPKAIEGVEVVEPISLASTLSQREREIDSHHSGKSRNPVSTDRTIMSPFHTLIADSLERPVLIERQLGNGRIWYLTANLKGYDLATLLSWILEMAGQNRELLIRDESDGNCARNILVSFRRYNDPSRHICVLLRNMDSYPKDLRITLNPGWKNYRIDDPLERICFDPPPGKLMWEWDDMQTHGIRLRIEGNDFRLLMFSEISEGRF